MRGHGRSSPLTSSRNQMKRSADFDFGALLARVASFASRRARWVVAVGLVVAIAATVGATRLEPSAGITSLGQRRRGLQGDRRLPQAVRRRRDRGARPGPQGRAARARRDGVDGRPRQAAAVGGLPVGQRPQEGHAGGARLRSARQDQADQGRLRARHVHQRGRRSDLRTVSGRGRQAPRTGRAHGQRRPQGGGRPRLQHRRSGALRRAGAPARLPELRARRDQAGAQVRADQRPGSQQPRLRAAAGVRPGAGRRGAQAALLVRFPQLECGADPGAAEAGPQRRRKARRDQAGA